jgi:hypothetical protein
MAAEYLLLDATDFLLLDASGDRLLLVEDEEVFGGQGGASTKAPQKQKTLAHRLNQQIRDEDDDLMRFVNEFLGRL